MYISRLPGEDGKIGGKGKGSGHVDRGRKMRNEVISIASDHKKIENKSK